ncbi:MAG: OmpA family protein [bacterium]
MRSTHAPWAPFVALGIALASLAVSRPVAAEPSLDGVSGLLRVHSAELPPQGYVAGTVWGQYGRGVYMPFQSPRGRAETVKFGDTGLSIEYAPSTFVELALRGTAQAQFLKSYAAGASETSFGIGDVGLGVKTLLTPASRKDFRLAAELDVATSTGSGDALEGSLDPNGFDIGGRLALTYAYRASEQDPGLRAHMNAGYLNRTGKFDPAAWAVTAAGPTPNSAVLHGDEFLYGVGLEMPVPRGWTAFAEWSGEYDVNADAAFSDNPMRITPGVRWSAPGGSVVVSSGVDVSLASAEAGPPWQVLGSVTFGGHLTPTVGTLLGVVRDADTGEPVANAAVAARNGAAQATTDATGKFRADIEQGYAVLEISAPGYTPKTRVVEVPAHRAVEFDFTLAKRNLLGAVNGHLTDAVSGQPIQGRVRVQGTEAWVETDAANGEFRLDKVHEGVVVLEVESRHHVATKADVRVAAGDAAVQNFALQPDPTARLAVVSGTVIDAQTGKPVAGTVTAKGKTTKTATCDPVTGRYEIELDAGAYNIAASGPGYAGRADTLRVAESETRSADFQLAAVPHQMTLSGVSFDAGAAVIKRESLTALEQAAKFLSANPTLAVVIEGHTDGAESPATSVALSQRRADAVLKYLVVNFGVDPGRLKARGVGADKPVAPNDTDQNRAKNRRIELVIEGAAQQ